MITAGCLGIGYYFIQQGSNDDVTRTVIFITLLFSNIFLTLVNRSFKYSILKTITYKNNLVLAYYRYYSRFYRFVSLYTFYQGLVQIESIIPGKHWNLCNDWDVWHFMDRNMEIFETKKWWVK